MSKTSSKSIMRTAFGVFKNKVFFFWLFIRTISAFAPLIVTFLISQIVKYLEAGFELDAILKLLVLLFMVEISDHLLRLSSKTRIAILTESLLIEIHKKLIARLNEGVHHRKELTQAIRNFTKSIRDFIVFFSDLGVAGFVSFAAIPIILLFIDFRLFLIELFLIGMYSFITYVSFRKYERHFESFDKSREYYFSALITTNNIEEEASYVRKFVQKVENTAFVNWMLLQNVISAINFVIILLVIGDVFDGTKDISDLVLIVGYVREAGLFLNRVTLTVQRYMEIKAGSQRVHAMYLKVKHSENELV